jgi:hypothetical protein
VSVNSVDSNSRPNGSTDRKLAGERDWLEELTTEVGRAKEQIGQPFKHHAALQSDYATRNSINDQLQAAANPPAPVAATAAAKAPDSPSAIDRPEQQPGSLADRARDHVRTERQPMRADAATEGQVLDHDRNLRR